MSRIDELIAELCPDGVEFRSLGELALYVRGVTYSKHEEQTDGPIRVLRSNNITLATNTLNYADVKSVSDSVRVRDNQWLRANDILVSAASGSKAHVGKVAYINEDIDYCFGGFMAVLRVQQQIESRFLFHLLIGRTFSEYLETALSTTTINNLNASIMSAFRIPIPPIEIQLEIVTILDTFTELEAELERALEAELEARRRQYAYYRDSLLSFTERAETPTINDQRSTINDQRSTINDQRSTINDQRSSVPWIPMGNFGKFFRGRRFTKSDYASVGISCIHYGEIYTHYGTSADVVISHIRPDIDTQLRFAKSGDVVITDVGETVEDVGKAVAWVGQEDVAIHDHCYAFRHSQNPKFLSYYMQTQRFIAEKAKYVARTKVNTLLIDGFSKIAIPIPPLEEQERIVAILDSFDALVNDLSIGLPAELKARRQQYEYYRDKLLTFEERVA